MQCAYNVKQIFGIDWFPFFGLNMQTKQTLQFQFVGDDVLFYFAFTQDPPIKAHLAIDRQTVFLLVK